MEEDSLFGKRLIALREERGCSLEEIAKHVGITKSVLSKYERGLHVPGLMAAKRIADFFNVSIDYITGNSDERNNVTRKIFQDLFKDLSENEKSDVIKYIEFVKSKKED
ncbi:helix-turn-helix domain-containing protein [Desulfosporosinus sp. SB140]|uniref:helix-turn-helix domain-containing protein n=1 Tax=Desulfosporosinus paludis TaxID=3115649 RepID=UPI00388E226A